MATSERWGKDNWKVGKAMTMKKPLVTFAAKEPEPAVVVQTRREQRAAEYSLAASTERVTYTDDTGRNWVVLVPKGRPQDAPIGVVVGPPDLRLVFDGVPDLILIRLHNELYARGLLTETDLRGRGGELQAAMQRAFRIDVQALLAAYRSTE